MKRRETDVAAPAVTYIQEHGWEVFQEVRFGGPGEPVADIVGRLQSPSGLTLIWVVEAKTSMSLDLLSQAVAWTTLANFVSVVTPSIRSKTYRAEKMIDWILSYHGIGRFTAGQYGSFHQNTPSTLHRLKRSAVHRWDQYLALARKSTVVAGTSHGGYWTPYKETCSCLRDYVNRNPGCGLTEAIGSIKHHYRRNSTAIASMRTWLQTGKVPGVRVEMEKGKIRLYLTPTSTP